jgi:hypothetical protein
MLDPKMLDGLKLVKEEYIATDSEVDLALEQAFTQGSQGWGVKRAEGVLLRLAQELKLSSALAATADEAGRMLKGAQLENGRLKKQAAIQAGLIASLERTNITKHAAVKDLQAQLDSAHAEKAVEADGMPEADEAQAWAKDPRLTD